MKKNKTKLLLICSTLIIMSGCASKSNMDVIKDSESGVVFGNGTSDSSGVIVSGLDISDAKNKIFNEDGFISMDESNISNEDKSYVLGNNLVHFSYDSYILNEESKKNIDKHIEILSKNNNIKIIIEGHTDQRGDPAYNILLGEKRAKAVKDYILSKSDIASERLEIISYGELQLVSQEESEESWSQNRRSVLVYN